jgi:hypothetical protein
MNNRPWVDLPLYHSRKERGSSPHVDPRPGISKICQLLNTNKFILKKYKISSAIIIGGAAHNGTCPMAEVCDKMGITPLQSFDPNHKIVKNMPMSDIMEKSCFEFSIAKPADLVISDVYVGPNTIPASVFIAELGKYVSEHFPRIIMIKITQSFSAHHLLSLITSCYTTMTICTSSVTGHSSELWFVFSDPKGDIKIHRDLLSIHKNFMEHLSQTIIFPQFLTEREFHTLNRGRYRINPYK